MCVAIRRDDLENPVVELQDRYIKSSAAQIVNSDYAILLFIETVRQGCGRRLVYQAQNFEAGDSSRVFCGLPLGIVEIRGDGNHRLSNRRAEETFRVAFELAQDEGRNLRRSESLIAELNAENFSGL